MTDYITRTGTPTFNKGKLKPHDRRDLRVAVVSHNATATAIPASNVVNMFTIPAQSIVLGATVDVSDNQANTDIKVGVTADDDYFSAVTALDANGTTITPTTVGTGGGQPFYTNAATNVTITAITNAINSAIITLRIPYIEVKRLDSTN